MFAGVLAVSLAASVALSYRIAAHEGEGTLEETLWIVSPRAARYSSLGYTGLAADIYWTRAVQYFGNKHRQRSRQYELLKPLLNLSTDLDPQLTIAYYFGSFFLAQAPPEGAGDPDAAAELVEKGIRNNPAEWRLYYHLGIIHYIERHDYAAAAQAFERGAQHPQAAPWLKVMAAAMRERSGDVNTARYLWTQIYENSQDTNIKVNALKHLASLRVDEDILHLEEFIGEYQRRHGRVPTSFRDLAEFGLGGTPLDPTGQPYVLRNGHVEVRDTKDFPFITRGLPPGQKAQSALP
jgi:tetratricopeptide (TPR) repeat protein